MNSKYILGKCYICDLPCENNYYCHTICAYERDKQVKLERKLKKNSIGNKGKSVEKKNTSETFKYPHPL
jgi:hypothetical protein